MDHVV